MTCTDGILVAYTSPIIHAFVGQARRHVVDGLYSRFGIFVDGDSLKQNGIRLIDYKMWLFINIAVFAFFIKCDIFY